MDMRVETTRFGTLEVDESSLVRMPRGPLGFEDQKEFCLIQHRPDMPFRWLQSTTDPALAFVVVDPADYFVGYEIEISDLDAELLQLTCAEDSLVLVIVTVGKEGETVTANLAAPVVVNSKTLVGMQIVLQDGRYLTQHLLLAQEERVSMENATAKAA